MSEIDNKTTELNEGITVLPSLHYIVFGTEDSERNKEKKKEKKKLFSEEQLEHYLRPKTEPPCVIMIEGPRGTFKATLARDFLINGLIIGESVLFIRLKDKVTFHPTNNRFKISEDCLKNIFFPNLSKSEKNEVEITQKHIDYFWDCFVETSGDEEFLSLDERYEKYKNNTKREITKWKYIDKSNNPLFIEIAFKSGNVLAEEFIKILLEVLMEHENKIKRIVIDDLSKIGVSYPFLFSSKTAGELFITALVHIVHNQRLSLVMTGTTGEYDKSDRMVERAKILADTVLSHKHCNVFGDKYITIMGDGHVHHAGDLGIIGDIVPAVLKPLKLDMFKIDIEILKGLVGFDTGDIYRPGITLFLFEETDLQKKYNIELNTLLVSAFSNTRDRYIEFDKKISVEIYPFGPDKSSAIHDGLGLLQGNPIAQTVLCTVDEFYSEQLDKVFVPVQKLLTKNDGTTKSPGKKDSKLKGILENTIAGFNIEELKKSEKTDELHTLPYYKNVLLLAYNETDFPEGLPDLWSEILEKSENKLLEFSAGTEETLSCLLIDAVISGLKDEIKKKKDKKPRIKTMVEILKTKPDLTNITNELYALCQLLQKSSKSDKWLKDKESKEEKSNVKEKRHKFYIHWYSELRDLLELKPQLASKIHVSALPGGGFRGDWHLGILKGSVNFSLGRKVLENLCSIEEDRKRFIKGIGLPTHKEFYDLSFKMWSNAPDELGKVNLIYKNANERKNIENYQKFRMLLSALCIELIQTKGKNEKEIKEKIEKNIINRLTKIISIN
jgi:hypothetical protein